MKTSYGFEYILVNRVPPLRISLLQYYSISANSKILVAYPSCFKPETFVINFAVKQGTVLGRLNCGMFCGYAFIFQQT
jgi:hypothetical protein